jgi:hypothetical protein
MQSKSVVRFARAEASEKIGAMVRSLTEFAGVAKGTLGVVVDVYEFDKDSFDVIIEWDSLGCGKRRDRFAKGPYEEFLSEDVEKQDLALV